MRHAEVTLDDKFLLTEGRVFITGVQALLRVLLDQHRLDQRAGPEHGRLRLRLSRLAAGRARPAGRTARGKLLAAADVVFKEGLNEDLAATAVWGSQQANLFPGAKLRWRLRHVVRQGARRRPHRRRLQARQLRRRPGPRAACWRWPATTTPASPRPCRRSRNTPSRTSRCRCCRRPTCRRCWTTACWATPCRASPACGSG